MAEQGQNELTAEHTLIKNNDAALQDRITGMQSQDIENGDKDKPGIAITDKISPVQPELSLPEPKRVEQGTLSEVRTGIKIEPGNMATKKLPQDRLAAIAKEPRQIIREDEINYLKSHRFTGVDTILRGRFSNLSDKQFKEITDDLEFQFFLVVGSTHQLVAAAKDLFRIVGSGLKLTKGDTSPSESWDKSMEWQVQKGIKVINRIMAKRKVNNPIVEPPKEKTDELPADTLKQHSLTV